MPLHAPMQQSADDGHGKLLVEVVKEVPCEKIVTIAVDKVVRSDVPVEIEHTIIKEISTPVDIPVERSGHVTPYQSQ